MHTLFTVRGIGIFAVLAGALVAGCTGGVSTPASPTAKQFSNISPSARFEAARASAEQQARRSVPAGFDLFVRSSYLVKHGSSVIAFTDRAVAQKSTNANSGITELANAFFQTSPGSRQTSTVHNICTPDSCPDPQPPDPTPPPDSNTDGGSAVITGTTPEADSIALARQAPCTQVFSTNGYPGAIMSGSGNTWTLQYRPGYPYYAGGTDSADVTTAVVLVDGTQLKTIFPATIANGFTIFTSVTYPGDIRKVRYVAIQVIDHVYPGDNLIMGEASVTCPADSPTIYGIAPLPPPIDFPPYRGWWQLTFPPA